MSQQIKYSHVGIITDISCVSLHGFTNYSDQIQIDILVCHTGTESVDTKSNITSQ